MENINVSNENTEERETVEEKRDDSLDNIKEIDNKSNEIPNRIMIQGEEQYNMYLKGLEAAVEQYRTMCPEKYEKAQSIGDDMMNKKYELVPGEDLKGDLLKCKNILMTVLQYGLEKSDLYENEIELLKKIFISVLNIVKDINDIIENVEMIENIITLIEDKLCEYENYY
jgi:hypothetical protein